MPNNTIPHLHFSSQSRFTKNSLKVALWFKKVLLLVHFGSRHV